MTLPTRYNVPMIRFLILIGLAGILCAGCSVTKEETVALPAQEADVDAQEEPAAEGPDLKKLQTVYSDAKAAFESDEAQLDSYLTAAIEFGNAVMMAPELAPRTKYPHSLAVFKEVLALDPENEEAQTASQTIIDIYGSMGREVPEGTVEDFPLNLDES